MSKKTEIPVVMRDPQAGRAYKGHSYTIDTPKLRAIWVYTSRGMAAIETQYENARAISEHIRCSRATAYRVLHRLRPFWLIDLRDPKHPTSSLVVRREDVAKVSLSPRGNPNFGSGYYQAQLARRPRLKR